MLPLEQARIPERMERHPTRPNAYRLVEHAETGQEGRIYNCQIIAVEPTLAVVRFGRYGGPLASDYHSALLIRASEGWKILVMINSAVS